MREPSIQDIIFYDLVRQGHSCKIARMRSYDAVKKYKSYEKEDSVDHDFFVKDLHYSTVIVNNICDNIKKLAKTEEQKIYAIKSLAYFVLKSKIEVDFSKLNDKLLSDSLSILINLYLDEGKLYGYMLRYLLSDYSLEEVIEYKGYGSNAVKTGKKLLKKALGDYLECSE